MKPLKLNAIFYQQVFFFLTEKTVYQILNIYRQFTQVRNNIFRKSVKLSRLQNIHAILYTSAPTPPPVWLFSLLQKESFLFPFGLSLDESFYSRWLKSCLLASERGLGRNLHDRGI